MGAAGLKGIAISPDSLDDSEEAHRHFAKHSV